MAPIAEKKHTRKHLLTDFHENFCSLSPECMTADLARFSFDV